jgi:hypothetical protein
MDILFVLYFNSLTDIQIFSRMTRRLYSTDIGRMGATRRSKSVWPNCAAIRPGNLAQTLLSAFREIGWTFYSVRATKHHGQ